MLSWCWSDPSYPDGLDPQFDVEYRPELQRISIDYYLPAPGGLPRVAQYRFVKARNEFDPKEVSQAEFRSLYNLVVAQVVVRTLHEVFESDYREVIRECLFNGWVKLYESSYWD